MLPIKTILHPTDFSEQSSQAFRMACAVARDYGARVVVCHVMALPIHAYRELGPFVPEPAVMEDEVRQTLEAVRPRNPAVAVEHRLCKGDAATEIVALAGEIKADVIVLGTHGRTGLSRLAPGSVAETVLRRAPCPVLTVKAPRPAAVAPRQVSREPAHV
jgi:nucleotide-binding universal stress UspA family protein